MRRAQRLPFRRHGIGTAFGTFGELLQGCLPGEPDQDFLVTLPIARWSVATFHPDRRRQLEIFPRHKRKSLLFARMLLDSIGADVGGLVVVDSNLPEGKGMASSSADMVAVARAVASSLAVDVPIHQVESLLARIEPTDGVLYPGIVSYHHRSVRLRELLGSVSPLTVVALDEGGQIDTLVFNAERQPVPVVQQLEYAVLLDRLTAALATHNLLEIGAVATRSAEMNQTRSPKRSLDTVMQICADHGGLGVVCAHSGTVLGILLDCRDPGHSRRLAAMANACYDVAEDVAVFRSLSFDMWWDRRIDELL